MGGRVGKNTQWEWWEGQKTKPLDLAQRGCIISLGGEG